MGKFTRIDTSIKGVYVIEPTVFGDNRGYFMETYSKEEFKEIGLNYDFVQDNESFSKEKGVLRGFMYCCLKMFLLRLSLALVMNFEALPPISRQ